MGRITGPLAARARRHRRVRAKVSGTPERPRLAIFRSLGHIYAQIINDIEGHTLAAASTVEPQIRSSLDGVRKTREAEVVGETIAQRALKLGINRVVFDRGGYQYHGRVKALAEAARAAGLQF
ncbi:MAG: 50S ribosomal protein L18 [Chloroflexi bacterium]|nr:50S ribosomal protein L18 [Chloroflexota bacterium]